MNIFTEKPTILLKVCKKILYSFRYILGMDKFLKLFQFIPKKLENTTFNRKYSRMCNLGSMDFDKERVLIEKEMIYIDKIYEDVIKDIRKRRIKVRLKPLKFVDMPLKDSDELQGAGLRLVDLSCSIDKSKTTNHTQSIKKYGFNPHSSISRISTIKKTNLRPLNKLQGNLSNPRNNENENAPDVRNEISNASSLVRVKNVRKIKKLNSCKLKPRINLVKSEDSMQLETGSPSKEYIDPDHDENELASMSALKKYGKVNSISLKSGDQVFNHCNKSEERSSLDDEFGISNSISMENMKNINGTSSQGINESLNQKIIERGQERIEFGDPTAFCGKTNRSDEPRGRENKKNRKVRFSSKRLIRFIPPNPIILPRKKIENDEKKEKKERTRFSTRNIKR